ncbi:hypothetical protein AALP_AA6G246200 [Arabis alpina]|uniref:Uncharacterized protein n=1 Tax=Arabis alpina TaxID=50452 RepID=A0A087GRG8_ARAAL|nr:hypothetical protein AALP_AA6G246200 [Arabis alpina]
MHKADDVSALGSVSGESNEPKGPNDASVSVGKRKVDPVDKKVEKKRITAKDKADLEAGRVHALWIGRTCEVPPFDVQSLGVTPHASLPVNSDSPVIPPSSVVQTTAVVSQPSPPRVSSLLMSTRSASELSCGSEKKGSRLASCSHVDVAWQEVGHQMHRVDSWEATASENQQNLSDLFDQANALKDEKHKLEEEVKKRDVNLEVASAEVTKLRANLEKSRLRESHLRYERDEARRRADQIASGSSAQSARHSSRLERIRHLV